MCSVGDRERERSQTENSIQLADRDQAEKRGSASSGGVDDLTDILYSTDLDNILRRLKRQLGQIVQK